MPFAHKRLLKGLVWMGLAIAASAAPGSAQDGSDGKAMRLTVRPSGYEAQRSEAQERQEKLLRRLEKSDHMIRSICIHCGDSWKHQSYAPFDPLAALGRSGRPSDGEAN